MKIARLLLAIVVALAACQTVPPDGQIGTTTNTPVTTAGPGDTETSNKTAGTEEVEKKAEAEESSTLKKVAITVFVLVPLVVLTAAIQDPYVMYHVVDYFD